MADNTRRLDGKPETSADKKIFKLRESGYSGPIDHKGDRVQKGNEVEHLEKTLGRKLR